MGIHLLNKNSFVSIEVSTDSGTHLANFNTKYYKLYGESEFIVESVDLYEFFSRNQNITEVLIEFELGHNKYSANGRIFKIDLYRGKKYVYISIISDVNVETRRAHNRFHVYMDVKIYSCRDGKPYKYIANGKTNDISSEAINIDADTDLRPFGECFFLEFKLFGKNYFMLPAEVLFQKDAKNYILGFDFWRREKDKTRLMCSFIENLVN